MDLIEYMESDAYKELQARYKAKFDDRIPTYFLMDLTADEFIKEVEHSINTGVPLLETDGSILY